MSPSIVAENLSGRQLPRHIAIIMDGNGRWAETRDLPRIAGHRRGAEAVRRTVSGAVELGIPYLTLFGFSSENWKRSSGEIHDLMGLLRHYLLAEIAELHRNGIRLKVIGQIDRLAPDIIELVGRAETLTRDNTAITLTMALSYGGRAEIVRAVQAIAALDVQGKLALDAIDEDFFGSDFFSLLL
jgi:undecaprenyl diphosphate synthase